MVKAGFVGGKAPGRRARGVTDEHEIRGRHVGVGLIGVTHVIGEANNPLRCTLSPCADQGYLLDYLVEGRAFLHSRPFVHPLQSQTLLRFVSQLKERCVERLKFRIFGGLSSH